MGLVYGTCGVPAGRTPPYPRVDRRVAREGVFLHHVSPKPYLYRAVGARLWSPAGLRVQLVLGSSRTSRQSRAPLVSSC